MTRPDVAGTIPIVDLLDRLPSEAEILHTNYSNWTVSQFRAMVTMVAGEMKWDDDELAWIAEKANAVVLKGDFGVQFEVRSAIRGKKPGRGCALRGRR